VLVTPSLTTVIDADLVLDDPAAMDIAQIANWQTGTLIIDKPGIAFNSLTQLINTRLELRGHVPALPVLSNIDSTSLIVSGGVTFELPLLTSYTNGSNDSREISASGAGTVVRFPALTTLAGYSYIGRNFIVSALGGATVELPELQQVTGGAVFFRSSGADSLLDLPRLGSFQGYFWSTLSGFEAVDQGTLHLASSLGAVTARTATIKVNDDAVFTFPQLELLADATLLGDGQFSGDVLVTAGVINPGDPTGQLVIDGDVTMGDGGRLAFGIGGLLPGEEHDQLVVTGQLHLAGTMQTSLTGGFGPEIGDVFTLAGWASGSGAFLDYAGLDAGESTEFVPFIEGNLLKV
jgi:hypothetical protein